MINAMLNDSASTKELIDSLILEGTRSGNFKFNLFIDLFLCTLFMLFLNYQPQKGFFSRHMLLFRWLAVVPVLYEIASLVIRILGVNGTITPPFLVYPFLTTKPPMTFVMFIVLALYIKFREYHFLLKGKTREDYKRFLQTNANSFQFSRFAAIILLVTWIMDLAIYMAVAIVNTVQAGFDMTAPAMEMIVTKIYAWGIGAHLPLINLLPFILLLSYTRTYKNSKVDLYIPVFGVCLAVIVTIEGLYQGYLMFAPGMVEDLLTTMMGGV